jgi:SAM-dependent methyltransferase
LSASEKKNRGARDEVEMHRDAMRPLGLALLDYHAGQREAEILLRRDDGLETPLPVWLFFRTLEEFSPIEREALEQCRGSVLDIGGGTGLHSLVLQEKGFVVTAIDVSPEACRIMVDRGVERVSHTDVLDFRGGPFDTLLLLGHGIGIAGDMAGLKHLLIHLLHLTTSNGQLLVHSVDVTATDDPQHLAYHEANRQNGRYVGEIRMELQYDDEIGAEHGWLHVDSKALQRAALEAGWDAEVLLAGEEGEYLARLTPWAP